MNNLCVILSVLVAYIDIVECNSRAYMSTERPLINCYFCATCPQPFDPTSALVSQVYTPMGWCAMLSTTNSSDAIRTRGAAYPNLCTIDGCSWEQYNGITTWVCCCNRNLCNTGIPTTTAVSTSTNTPTSVEPVGVACYYCSTCPQPFDPTSALVSQIYTPTGWCAMLSFMNSSDAIRTRGVAYPNLCTIDGCSWKQYNGIATWVCCCNQNLCNTGIPSTTFIPTTIVSSTVTISPTTTVRPTGITCYYCLTCPQPFDSNSPYVSQLYSTTSWCVTMSTSNSSDAISSRGVAYSNLCSRNECYWTLITGINTWVCCCNQNLCNMGIPTTTVRPAATTSYCNEYQCNTGISTSESTIRVLGAVLLMIILARLNF